MYLHGFMLTCANVGLKVEKLKRGLGKNDTPNGKYQRLLFAKLSAFWGRLNLRKSITSPSCSMFI